MGAGVVTKRRITNKKALAGVWLAFIGILVTIRVVAVLLPIPSFFEQKPFNECEPNKIINLLGESFAFELPSTITSARAAEKIASWIDHPYVFSLRITTDLVGWEQFHASFPKIRDREAVHTAPDGSSYVDDVYGFCDYDTNVDDPRRRCLWKQPEFFDTDVAKGKHYVSSIDSKDHSLQIDTICVDLSDSDRILIWIEGWGPYDSKYGLD